LIMFFGKKIDRKMAYSKVLLEHGFWSPLDQYLIEFDVRQLTRYGETAVVKGFHKSTGTCVSIKVLYDESPNSLTNCLEA